MTASNITGNITPQAVGFLRDELEAAGFKISLAPDMLLQAKSDGCNVSVYRSGRALIQGAQAECFGRKLEAKKLLKLDSNVRKPITEAASLTNLIFPRIGSDESGKGDYFGPLVTAAVFLDEKAQIYFERIGVKDSKTLSGKNIADLARRIERETLTAIVAIGPERYNDLYKKMHSVNRLLGWAHARAIENLLEKLDSLYQVGQRPTILAIADQFGDEKFIESQLFAKGKAIELRQMPKAETDIAVAAASILARNDFVLRLDWLGRDIGMNLPKGASEKVVEAGKAIVSRFGSQKLASVAKLHFKTTDQVRAFR